MDFFGVDRSSFEDLLPLGTGYLGKRGCKLMERSRLGCDLPVDLEGIGRQIQDRYVEDFVEPLGFLERASRIKPSNKIRGADTETDNCIVRALSLQVDGCAQGLCKGLRVHGFSDVRPHVLLFNCKLQSMSSLRVPRRLLINQEILQLATRLDLFPQPQSHPAATGPGLVWVVRVTVLGPDAAAPVR